MDLRARATRLIEGQDIEHSAFQIKVFIVAKAGLDDYSRYLQCLRQITSGLRAIQPRKPTRWQRVKRLVGLWRNVPIAPGRELTTFIKIAEELHERLVGEHGDPLPLATLDKAMWIRQVAQKGLTELFLDGRLSPNTVDTLLALPATLRDALALCFGRAAGGPELVEKLDYIVAHTTALGTLAESGSNSLRSGFEREPNSLEAMESEPSGTA